MKFISIIIGRKGDGVVKWYWNLKVLYFIYWKFANCSPPWPLGLRSCQEVSHLDDFNMVTSHTHSLYFFVFGPHVLAFPSTMENN